MKIVTIEPVSEPDTFSGSHFTKAEYAAVKRGGELEVDYATAKEAIKNSKGAYRIKPPARPQVELPSLPDVNDMGASEVAQELAQWGKPPRKRMKLTVAREFLLELRSKADAMIVEDDAEEE